MFTYKLTIELKVLVVQVPQQGQNESTCMYIDCLCPCLSDYYYRYPVCLSDCCYYRYRVSMYMKYATACFF